MERYVPPMSKRWLTPLYGPLVRLLRMERHHRTLLDLAELKPEERVLDIGTGTGNLALLLKRRHPDVGVVGIDPDPGALDRARRKAVRTGTEVAFERGVAERLPFPDHSFDRVVSAFMFHHLGATAKRDGLGEVRRVLRRGGSLHLVDFGGAVTAGDGFAARLQRHHHRMADNLGHRVIELLGEAGFDDVAEVDSCVTRLGRITHYRASVDDAPRAAAEGLNHDRDAPPGGGSVADRPPS